MENDFIFKLLKRPDILRDEKWEDSILKALPEASFELVEDHPIQGPDGMPYLPVKIVTEGEKSQNVFNWLGEKGVGLVISPEKTPPDFALNYGMIWWFLGTGHFLEVSQETQNAETFEVNHGAELYVGAPTEGYFPPTVRNLFREFLKAQDVHEAKIAMVSKDQKKYDLCFSWESLQGPPQEEWEGILKGFSWFFPLHYSFSILSEEVIGADKFIKL